MNIPKILCDSCKHLHSQELISGHKRRGWCSLGAGWVEMGKCRQCLYCAGKKKHAKLR